MTAILNKNQEVIITLLSYGVNLMVRYDNKTAPELSSFIKDINKATLGHYQIYNEIPSLYYDVFKLITSPSCEKQGYKTDIECLQISDKQYNYIERIITLYQNHSFEFKLCYFKDRLLNENQDIKNNAKYYICRQSQDIEKCDNSVDYATKKLPLYIDYNPEECTISLVSNRLVDEDHFSMQTSNASLQGNISQQIQYDL